MTLAPRTHAALGQVCNLIATWIDAAIGEQKTGGEPHRIYYDMWDFGGARREAVIQACQAGQRTSPEAPAGALLDAIGRLVACDMDGGIMPVDMFAAAAAAIEGDAEMAAEAERTAGAHRDLEQWLSTRAEAHQTLEALALQRSGFEHLRRKKPHDALPAFREAARAWAQGQQERTPS